MTVFKPSFLTAACAGALILGSLTSCGVTAETEEEMEQASVSAKIETVIVTPDPCMGCARARIAEAAARERAMQQAAAEAEARARSARDAQAARISRCASQRATDIKECNATFTRAGQSLAADNGACYQRAVTGCSSGSTSKQIATCIGNVKYVAEEQRRSCIHAIPSTASEQARSQAAGSCFTVEALIIRDESGFCNGAENYGGQGSPSALCTENGKYNCDSNHATALARQDANRVACIAIRESQFLDCLLPGM